LRTIRAIFRASAGFNTQQGTYLNGIRVKMFSMNGLRLKKKIIERQIKQCLNLLQRPGILYDINRRSFLLAHGF